MKTIKMFSILISILLIFNCSTPYQPQGTLGGYSEEKITSNIYVVKFQGNQHTKPEKVQNYLLYRCAELTKERGYAYFTAINEEHHFDEYVAKKDVNQPWVRRGSMSGGLKVYANPDLQNSTSSTNYTAVLYIKFLSDVDEKHKNAVFNAEEVMEELSDRVQN